MRPARGGDGARSEPFSRLLDSTREPDCRCQETDSGHYVLHKQVLNAVRTYLLTYLLKLLFSYSYSQLFFSVKLRCGFYLKDSLDLGFRRFFAGVLLNCNALVAAKVFHSFLSLSLFRVGSVQSILFLNWFFDISLIFFGLTWIQNLDWGKSDRFSFHISQATFR